MRRVIALAPAPALSPRQTVYTPPAALPCALPCYDPPHGMSPSSTTTVGIHLYEFRFKKRTMNSMIISLGERERGRERERDRDFSSQRVTPRGMTAQPASESRWKVYTGTPDVASSFICGGTLKEAHVRMMPVQSDRRRQESLFLSAWHYRRCSVQCCTTHYTGG